MMAAYYADPDSLRVLDVLGHYSHDENRQYLDDDSCRKFFVKPPEHPNFDLLEGHEDFQPRIRGVGLVAMDSLQMWMRDHQDELRQEKVLIKASDDNKWRLNIDFVAGRSHFVKLLRAAYNRKRLDIAVTLYRGTFYLKNYICNYEQHRNEVVNYTEEWRFRDPKFRQYITSVDGLKPDTSRPVVYNEDYIAAVKVGCGGNTLLSATIISGEEQGSPSSSRKYIDIHTKKGPGDVSWTTKMNWWTRCKMAGIQKVACGSRDDELRKITSVKTYNIIDEVARGAKFNPDSVFSPDACVGKLQQLLEDIRRLVTDDNPRSVYHLVLEEITDEGRGRYKKLDERTFVSKGKTNANFAVIKDWFIEEVLGGE